MRRILAMIIAVMMGITTFEGTAFGKESQLNLANEADSAILIERDTGNILFEKNSNKELPPASMTKIMTMLLIMEAIEDGDISLKDKVRTSEYAASMGGSQIFLEPGETMTVDEMLRGIAIASANDASVAMAEFIAGSEEAFVVNMNKKIEELGLKNTHFSNPTGLPAENHYSTSHDMAQMAKELLKYPLITKYTGEYEDYLRENTDKKFWLVNTNKLVKFYSGVDGLKTGYTKEAKYCLTATAKKEDMRVIAVVMGAPTAKSRNQQVTSMFDYAFSQYKTHRLYERNQIINTVDVNKGDKRKVTVVTAESVSILTKKGESEKEVTTKMKLSESLEAPIQKGQEVGKLVLEKDGKVLSETALLSSQDIQQASWWQLFKRTLAQFAAGN
ncbi:D-alanyl-D-alanine carboxypeptidase family protein [Bacillus taeanensis]